MTDLARDPAERGYLEHVLRVLDHQLASASASIDASARALDAAKTFMWDQRRDMDGSEKAAMRTALDVSVATSGNVVKTRAQLERLAENPYFARVDFAVEPRRDLRHYYIGVHTLWDAETTRILVHDWRAPVSSLFYDYESGPASFVAPEGVREGEITGKRQYKISGGALEYVIETSMNIGDDVLQQELNRSADDKMKNIVATIQREQNAVIRNEDADVLIVQGVAGSGKTSIALHRVAFLLYRFKDTLNSENVMILSPNRVFGDYISDVLPELGEEQVAEIDFDRIASRFLDRVTGYQVFGEQVSSLLERSDEATTSRVRYKATARFVEDLNAWIASADDAFAPVAIEHRGEELGRDWVAGRLRTMEHEPVFTRIERLTNSAIAALKQRIAKRRLKWAVADANAVRKQVQAMFPYKDAFALYRAFYSVPEREGLFVPLGRKKIEFADVFPLVYTIISTTRQEGYGRIKHLIVDEMQDHTPIQYAVLRRLFDCTMTILGDANQSVNPFSSSSLASIREIFTDAVSVELHKSYRSTLEIVEFAQHIRRNDDLIPVERHGERPAVHACSDDEHQLERIVELVRAHRVGVFESLGIVCKTLDRARELHAYLAERGIGLTLLDYDSTEFADGIVITSAHISKGLEFDEVIVPDAGEDTFGNEVDRSMLYIACTRAMHALRLTHVGNPSAYLPLHAGHSA
ncbi:HelD family protein [Zhihengliuella halotolerans]|uniref:HelD family protein n=1 Tax=Zhihengliuella halotolerans TaxID=370736 RepID=UPI000C7FDBA7|nr:UvrD-helicase domain-containing protein [Zhihengliuella halotolerans]